jgi:predicted enzyme related to lactoylglutathione lyase
MGRVIHFEIHAADPERAVRFYRALLGWQMVKWDGPEEYWLITTGPKEQPGINGGMVRRRGPAPVEGQAVNAFVCTVEVENLQETLSKVETAGGVLAVATMPIAGVGWLAFIKDTEGNLLGLMQRDPGAK